MGLPPRSAPPGAGFTKPAEACEPAPTIEKFSEKYNLAYLQAEMPVSVDHGIIGLMDPAHGPFVHQAWWWRTQHSIHEKKKNFEPIPNGFRMARTRLAQTPRPTSFCASMPMLTRSPPPSTSSFPTSGPKPFARGNTGFPA